MDLIDDNAKINRGNFIETEEEDFSRTKLGGIATREDYRLDNEPRLVLEQPEESFEASKVTLDREATDGKVENDLNGFTVIDSMQEEFHEDIDELPEDLKSELGEPDTSEEHEQ